jgi:hypothetical protein
MLRTMNFQLLLTFAFFFSTASLIDAAMDSFDNILLSYGDLESCKKSTFGR